LKLRDYQQASVDATLSHFRRSNDSGVLILPTGAGKSLVIAELARLAHHPILVLAHVKELVAQNAAKYQALGKKAGIFSAGLGQKNTSHQVTFASIQSAARNQTLFSRFYSLVIIDECHRVSDEEDSQYQQLIDHLRQYNSQLKILGLTATPYRLKGGWIYQYDYRGFVRTEQPRPFSHCIYELPLATLVRRGYLTAPRIFDAPIAEYRFDACRTAAGQYSDAAMNHLLVSHQRVTQSIIEQIVSFADKRQGVMIFAATVKHAKEILGYLPSDDARLVLGETDGRERDEIIESFKAKAFKYLVNVAVLTTGFDAPHVDFIALLRPTESVSLYQQMVGRGLRLASGKEDCLVIDYAGTGFDLYYPEIGQPKPDSTSELVQVFCPACGFANTFWGKQDSQGQLIEHYGRRCQGLIGEDEDPHQCDYRFRYKQCPQCMGENDIAARTCNHCDHQLIDPDEQLKKALSLRDAKVIRCAGMSWTSNGDELTITYHDEDGEELSERFYFDNTSGRACFETSFKKRQWQSEHQPTSAAQAVALQHAYRAPDFVIARKNKHYWQIKERIFDYQGQYRLAHRLA
jgi:DNA repair protein RadD